MHDLTLEPATDPLELYRYRDGLYAADMLTAAITGLDFFTFLAGRARTKTEICAELKIDERPTDVMLTLFTAMGLVENRAGQFELTVKAGEHLVRNSPWYLGPYYASLQGRPVCQDILNVLKTGKPANWASLKDEQAWAKAMERAEFAAQFTAAMDCRGVYLAQALAKYLELREHSSLLDIAGGSGIYACSLVARHSHLRATVLEKKPVDSVAQKKIAERGFSGRVSVAAGDMFKDELPAGHDVHLFSNVLHDWDAPEVEHLIGKCFAALPRGGMVVIHDMHVNADKSGPLAVAAYSAMLATITEGKCYAVSEMNDFLIKAGFREPRFSATAADRSVIAAVK
ncbi:MAG: methyltransferase [Verrucomicrobia subdivision 3 bacterium]|nr:methyltransferase [Limisphaerales bacterium]